MQVIEVRKDKVFLPKRAMEMERLQNSIIQTFYENGYKERIIFPITNTVEMYTSYYSDIKLEYLVDFCTKNNEELCFNPEYKTYIKNYFFENVSSIQDYSFYYLQQTLSYTSVEREHIKEDTVLGIVTINPKNTDFSWLKMAQTIEDATKELVNENNLEVHASTSGIINVRNKDIIIGSGNNTMNDGILEAHISLTDLYDTLN